MHKGRTVSRRRIHQNNNLSNNNILEVCDSKNENENFMEIEINESYECPSFSAEKRKNYSNTSLQGLVNKEYNSAKTYDDRPVQYNASIQTYEKNEKPYFPGEDYTNFESMKNENFGYDNMSFKNNLKDVEKDKDKEKDKEKGRGKGRERQKEKEKGREKDVDNVKVKIKENRNKDSYNENSVIENLDTDTNKIINKNDNNTNNDDMNNTENHTKEHPRDITKLLGKMRKNKRRMSFPRQSSTESLETKNLNMQKDDSVSSSNKDLTENRGRRAASEAGVGVGMGVGGGMGLGLGVGRESGTGSGGGTGIGTGGGAGAGSKTSISSSRNKSILWTSELDSRFVIITFILLCVNLFTHGINFTINTRVKTILTFLFSYVFPFLSFNLSTISKMQF